MSSTEAWTKKRLLEWTTDYLTQNGSDSARLDAEVLLAEALECQRIQLYTSFDEVPSEDQLAKFRGWIRERAAGKPVAYLVGHREFYSLPFRVNEHVLIPRSETELLVTLAIDFLATSGSETPLVCDVGTGSGCVAVAIAKNNPKAKITALDISPDAIELAAHNAQANGVSERIQFTQSDLFESISESQTFDLVVSNPPYVGLREKEDLPRDVRDHEPHLALFAGDRGTDIISRLVQQTAARLNPGGMLLFETSPIIMDECVEIVRAEVGFSDIEVHRDLAKQPRVVSACLAKND